VDREDLALVVIQDNVSVVLQIECPEFVVGSQVEQSGTDDGDVLSPVVYLDGVDSQMLNAAVGDVDLGDAAASDVSLIVNHFLVVGAVGLVVGPSPVEGVHVSLVVDAVSDEVLLVLKVEASNDSPEDSDENGLVVEQVLAHKCALDCVQVRPLL
jgi:hypothetical protein